MKKFVILLAFLASPLSAQNQDLGTPVAEGGEIETIGAQESDAEDGGLSFTVTDENDWADLGVAIPRFATDRDVATQASRSGTGELGREIARVITANLRNNGLFQPVGPDSLPQPSFTQITDPNWATWRGRGAEMLVHGYVRARSDGRLMVGCYLYDVHWVMNWYARAGWFRLLIGVGPHTNVPILSIHG